MEANINKFVDKVKSILQFSDIQNVVSKHPPYLQACMRILGDVVGPAISGPLTIVIGPLSNKYKLLLDTLVCCMTSYARERLINSCSASMKVRTKMKLWFGRVQ